MLGMLYYIITILKAIIITPIVIVTKADVMLMFRVFLFFFNSQINNRRRIKSEDKVKRKIILFDIYKQNITMLQFFVIGTLDRLFTTERGEKVNKLEQLYKDWIIIIIKRRNT